VNEEETILRLQKFIKNSFTAFLILVSVSTEAQDRISSELPAPRMKIMYQTVAFESEGARLRGRLYLPENESGKLPVLIMTHGYSATIEGMVADNYAEAFCRAGFAVLLYDHRNFGISDGQPRQQINR
jgi:cephalosporin-C deacetylase-like acetyl esterase